LEIFRRFNADSTAFHTPNTTHTTFTLGTSPAARKTPPFFDFDRNFFPVGDFSTFKRSFYCISHAEYNALHFRDETSRAARKTPPFFDFDRNFFPVADISTFKC
jgi:hypothetical protein